MNPLYDTLRDTIALVGGGIAESDTDNPELSAVVHSVIDDLRSADFDDVVVSFLGITMRLVDALARQQGEDPDEYWNRIAGTLSARLAELENQA